MYYNSHGSVKTNRIMIAENVLYSSKLFDPSAKDMQLYSSSVRERYSRWNKAEVYKIFSQHDSAWFLISWFTGSM